VRIEQKNEVKIKLRVENGGHLPKLGGRRAQEYLVKNLEEEKKYGLLFLQKLQQNGRTSLGFGF